MTLEEIKSLSNDSKIYVIVNDLILSEIQIEEFVKKGSELYISPRYQWYANHFLRRQVFLDNNEAEIVLQNKRKLLLNKKIQDIKMSLDESLSELETTEKLISVLEDLYPEYAL